MVRAQPQPQPQPQPQQQVRVRYDRVHPVRFEAREASGAATTAVVLPLLIGIIFTAVGILFGVIFANTIY